MPMLHVGGFCACAQRKYTFLRMRRSHHVAVNMEDQERKPDPERFWAPLAIEYGKYSPLMAGSIDGTDDRPHDRAVERAMRAKCDLPSQSM